MLSAGRYLIWHKKQMLSIKGQFHRNCPLVHMYEISSFPAPFCPVGGEILFIVILNGFKAFLADYMFNLTGILCGYILINSKLCQP